MTFKSLFKPRAFYDSIEKGHVAKDINNSVFHKPVICISLFLQRQQGWGRLCQDRNKQTDQPAGMPSPLLEKIKR